MSKLPVQTLLKGVEPFLIFFYYQCYPWLLFFYLTIIVIPNPWLLFINFIFYCHSWHFEELFQFVLIFFLWAIGCWKILQVHVFRSIFNLKISLNYKTLLNSTTKLKGYSKANLNVFFNKRLFDDDKKKLLKWYTFCFKLKFYYLTWNHFRYLVLIVKFQALRQPCSVHIWHVALPAALR